MGGVVERGDHVLLIGRDGASFVGRAGEVLKRGDTVIPTEKIVGIAWGGRIDVLGREYTVARPTMIDFMANFRRGPQIVHPATGMRIAHLAGVHDGSTVVEGGTGSGFLTFVLAWMASPSGVVHTYEIDRKAHEVAVANLGTTPLENVMWHQAPLEECDVREADALVLDLPEPWRYWDLAREVLRPGGVVICHVPTTTQMERTMRSAPSDFTPPEGSEMILRDWILSKGKEGLRPSFTPPSHAGFIVVSRRL